MNTIFEDKSILSATIVGVVIVGVSLITRFVNRPPLITPYKHEHEKKLRILIQQGLKWRHISQQNNEILFSLLALSNALAFFKAAQSCSDNDTLSNISGYKFGELVESVKRKSNNVLRKCISKYNVDTKSQVSESEFFTDKIS